MVALLEPAQRERGAARRQNNELNDANTDAKFFFEEEEGGESQSAAAVLS